jgi:hypothetical protein
VAKRKRMTCMVRGCGRTLRRKACPVHGKGAMAASSAVKAVLSANAAAIAKAATAPSVRAGASAPEGRAEAGIAFLAKAAKAGPAQESVRELLVREMAVGNPYDPRDREAAWKTAHAWLYRGTS